MRIAKRIAIVVIGVLTAVTAVATPASAVVPPPTEWNEAVSYGMDPVTDGCMLNTYAQACFRKDGDIWFVKDMESDGYPSVVYWQNHYNGEFYRQGICINKLTAGHWGTCNKDYHEGSLLSFKACRYIDGELKNCTDWKGVNA
ncbi:MAG: hypothetical protein HOV77_06615 [Hamadaea sp.]|uniref:hypothetical protein n=1 Tax=Hamadaea sp. TaxID=2024425 RepID=UPI0017D15FAB|nr:hypothetical protein [Hamadaea sp.]NUT18839.1 hypothetical protein [Hamadaea sp.]